MKAETIFEKLRRSFEEFAGRYKAARTEQQTAETLVASAEYELEQLKRLVSEHKLAR